jgi:hypothetical protein
VHAQHACALCMDRLHCTIHTALYVRTACMYCTHSMCIVHQALHVHTPVCCVSACALAHLHSSINLPCPCPCPPSLSTCPLPCPCIIIIPAIFILPWPLLMPPPARLPLPLAQRGHTGFLTKRLIFFLRVQIQGFRAQFFFNFQGIQIN